MISAKTAAATPPPLILPPPVVCWMVTPRCNMRCVHCEPEAGPRPESPSLDFAGQKGVVARFAAGGVQMVLLSGGEPLMLPHVYELMDTIRTHGMGIWVSTNGSLIDEAAAERIAAIGVEGVVVGFDSARAEVHDRLRGHAGAHAAALCAIRLLRKQNVKVNVNYVATQMTCDGLQELLPAASDLGVNAVLVNRFRPLGRGMQNRRQLALTLEEYRDMVEALLRSYPGTGTKLSFEDPAFYGYCRQGEHQDKINWDGAYAVCGCQAGILCLGVMPNGDVTPCAFLHVAIGNIVRDDLEVIVAQSDLLKRLLDRDDRGGQCGTCEERWRCGGCRAHAYAASGDCLAEDPFCLHSL